jgi:hypothetical protein
MAFDNEMTSLWTDGGHQTIMVRAGDRGVSEGIAGWLNTRRAALRAELAVVGSVVIRDLPVFSPNDFAAARDAVIENRTAYREKATPRSDYGDDVFSSTDMPAEHDIRLHNENSYTMDFPGLLLFGCLVQPASGGATTVADSRDVLAGLSPGLAGRFRRLGWCLVRNYHPHMGLDWPVAFGTTNRSTVEDYCRDNEIAWRWLPGGGLTTSQQRPATIRHPMTNDEVWFNHIAFWNEYSLDPEVREVLVSSYGPAGLPFNTTYGDGSAIGADEIAEINEVYDAVQRSEPWRTGDLLLVDNILSSHGRQAYTGDRRIVVAMGEPLRVRDCAPSTAPRPGPLPGQSDDRNGELA